MALPKFFVLSHGTDADLLTEEEFNAAVKIVRERLKG
jgi:hypothetical protein